MCKKIMVVEDHFDTSVLIKIILEKEGFKVISVNNGQTALDKATEEKPDVITLDVILSDVHGLEVLRQLRTTPETTAIPIIFVTVLDKEGLIPADGYLNKPFKIKELVNLVNEVAQA